MIPTQTTKPYPFLLSTDDAHEFVTTLTQGEARSMLLELLGRDESAFIRAMERVQRQRARFAASSGETR